MLLKYVISYPFSPIFVAKVHHFVAFVLLAFLWIRNRAVNFAHSTSFTLLAVFDLLALLCSLLSVWLTVQKCYIVRVEIGFSTASIVLLTLGSLCTFPIYDENIKNVLHAINIIHGYTIALLGFATWGWGDANDDDQLEEFDFGLEEQ
ncbi:hypothetical protein QR680_005981 [Steinernema hermaphroditum]|uniref:Uncharacterized protein n=1 Tax=Steinernema hermaphroditum TaxID=289476 RepID=A0AA39HTW4_9BILA|nr:hypothetical protein QR680_005981 [Steinernema hermaphroditum]